MFMFCLKVLLAKVISCKTFPKGYTKFYVVRKLCDIMNCVPPVIVDAINNSVKTFANVSKITVGRNQNSSIDIPDPNISRNQCIITLTDDNKWTIKDLSSHKTTFLNNKRLIDHTPILENGDKITFPCPSIELFFYYSIDDVPTIFKKRKPEGSEKETLLSTPSKKVCRESKTDDVTEEIGTINVAEKNTLGGFKAQSKPDHLQVLSDELEKYKQLYLNALEELTGIKDEKSLIDDKCNNATKELEKLKSQMKDQISILEKEKDILIQKLKREEEVNEKMVLEVQELNERLKESEQEQIRLAKESDQSNNEVEKEPEKDEAAAKAKEKEDDYFSALALQKIVDLVEVKYHEVELDQLKTELKKKDDRITDLTLENEKRKQEVMDVIDRELLCSICSEVLCNAITLNCKHTFCHACVVEWKNKKRECPVCRTRIKFEVHPLLIDSFLDRLFDVVGGELKTRRDEVKAERSNSVMNAPSTSKGNSNNLRRGSHHHRNSRRGRANFNSLASMNLLQPQLVIDLRDIGQELLSGNVIDLTANSPQARRGRSRSINYYNL